MDYYLILYFVVGVVHDFLLTLNWRYVARHKIMPAVAMSFLVTIIFLLVIYDIVSRLDSGSSIVAIIVYAAGVATGTLLAMKFKVGFGVKVYPACPVASDALLLGLNCEALFNRRVLIKDWKK